MTMGQRIKERRMQLGLSVEALAEKLGKNRATIYRYEGDDIENFPVQIIEPLAEALQTSPAYLMGWSDSFQPKKHRFSALVRERISAELSSYDEADIQAARETLDIELLNRIVEKEGPVSIDDAIEAADMLGLTLSELIGNDEPAPMEDAERDEIVEKFTSLTPENQQRLIDYASLLLIAQQA